MDSDSMHNLFFSNSGDFNSYNNNNNNSYNSVSEPANSSLVANNNCGQMMDPNEAFLFRQCFSQSPQQQQDFSSQQNTGAGQMFDTNNSMVFGGNVQEQQQQMNTNQNFSGYGNMSMQQSFSNSNYENVPQAVSVTPISSQSDFSSSSNSMYGFPGMNGVSNASFMGNASSSLVPGSNASFMNPSVINALAPDSFVAQGILGPWSERSAGLLGTMVCTDPSNTQGKVKRTRRKQPKDKPKRPLSAYNIFFKEERQRLLNKAPTEAATVAESTAKRTANGKIGFESLAKIIGGKWQDLKPAEVEYYKEKAGADMQRYKSEMDEYRKKRAEKADNNDDEDEQGDDNGSKDSKRQRFE